MAAMSAFEKGREMFDVSNWKDIPPEIEAGIEANPVYCEMFLKQLQAKGVQFSKPISDMTHDDMKRALYAIWDELRKREMH